MYHSIQDWHVIGSKWVHDARTWYFDETKYYLTHNYKK